MSTKATHTIGDNLYIIWTITSKDIVDALKSRVVVWMIIMLCVMLLVPKLLPYIFEHEQTVLPIYDTANTTLVADLEGSTSLSVQELHSEQEFELALCSAIYPEIGLVIPADIRPTIGGESVEFQGYSCWGKRHQASEAQPKLEELLSQSLGMQVEVNIQGNIIYPPSEGVLYISLATVNSIVLILMIGMFIVPNLLIEEKETKTMEALLASPASIAQVVSGKALAGLFYILVSAIIIFLITWTDIIHWDMVLLFVIGSGIFSVAVGLVLGSVFNKPQDMAGWMVAILLILVGAVLLKTLGVELPAFVSRILPWVPSVALAEIYRGALSQTVSIANIWFNFGIILAISLLLYSVVIVVLRRSDR